MKVESLIFRPVDGYLDVPIRPYEVVEMDENNLSLLNSATQGGYVTNASAVAEVAGRMIRPTSQIESIGRIVHGYNQPRFQFQMVAVVRESQSFVTKYLIIGYSDHGDFTNLTGTVNFDPEMCLWFDKLIKIDHQMIAGHHGNQWGANISRSEQIISNAVDCAFDGSNNHGTMTMRPYDLFQRNTGNAMWRDAARNSGEVFDLRSGTLESAIKFSQMTNVAPSQYLSKNITAMVTANAGNGVESEQFIRTREKRDIYKDAMGQVREHNPTMDPLFEEIAVNSNIMNDGYIRLCDLFAMNPGLEHDDKRCLLMKVNTPVRRGHFGNYASPTGGDNEDIMATMIANALPLYMVHNELGYVQFTATNLCANGESEVAMATALSIMNGRPLRQSVPLFVQRLKTELLRDILPYPGCTYDMSVTANALMDINIQLKVDGGQEYEFLFPLFSSGICSSIVTENVGYMDQISDAIGGMVDYFSANDSDNTNSSIYTGHDPVLAPY